MALLDELKVLANLDKLNLNWKGKFDGQPATVNGMQMKLGNLQKITVNVKFSVGDQSHTINGAYSVKGGGADEIKFDGSDVTDDDVDFDVIAKLGLPPYALIQFEFRFTDSGGAHHEFVAYSKQKLPLPLPV